MPTISIYIDGKWLPFDSLSKDHQRRIRKKMGEVLAATIRHQVEILMAKEGSRQRTKKPL